MANPERAVPDFILCTFSIPRFILCSWTGLLGEHPVDLRAERIGAHGLEVHGGMETHGVGYPIPGRLSKAQADISQYFCCIPMKQKSSQG
jgi:hypothetical protein